MFEVFPYAIAAFDADQDGDMDCVMVVKQYLDPKNKRATYAMRLPSLNGRPGENHTYNLREGATPDKPIFTLDDGVEGGQTINYIYTNYKNCALVEFPFKNKKTAAFG
ncbi:hypothetical protein MTO96_042413 [Rhipicephalus appendiculatus]